MKRIILILAIIGIVITGSISILTRKETAQSKITELKVKVTKKSEPSVDHSKFDILKKKFDTPQQATEACLTCHNGRAKEVMQSNHWNWERPEYIEGRGVVYLGKKNAINNFCIGSNGNEQSCAKCHIGYSQGGKTMSAKDAERDIDCLVCHDNTSTYVKASEKAGAPDPNVDLNNVAQHVGKPKRENCGVCHFFGGGGNNVKHGDLEKAMFDPKKEVDIHMATNGANLQCVDCHKTEKHNITGKMYSLSSMNRNRATCEECHSSAPHKDGVINNHSLKVACQTCHIPTYAKANSTKTEWDWSTAGKLRDGEPYEEDDSLGNHTYLSIKGSFKWGRNLNPDYAWFNGTATHYLLGDKIEDTSKVTDLNPLGGSYKDANSKIIPLKIHIAKQPFDPINKTIIQPRLFATEKGEGGFWKDFDWTKASEVGMKDVNLPFSGKVSFVKTSMNWPINHMVSSKEKTMKCEDCHNSKDSKLAGLNDFYMPARDHNATVDTLGKLLAWATLLGVLIHAAFRIFNRKKIIEGAENEE